MTISTQDLIASIEARTTFSLDPEQKDAITYGNGPLMITAGPGTGKTEVLVSRCLKFICCDGIDPASIFLTTFTEKAAKSLEDRLTEGLASLVSQHPSLKTIDPSTLRIGTLHSLCNEILQENRYTEYQNLRLLDEMERALLFHRGITNNIDHLKVALYQQFGYLFDHRPFDKIGRWDWTFALLQPISRLIEDEVELAKLQAAGSRWAALYEVAAMFDAHLKERASCDFTNLLRYFRDFLNTGQGHSFLQGRNHSAGFRPGVTHVLVDEYQDTNPIQESIYFRLSDTHPHNLTIVGDDDQALYRFRGGTVECMVGFPNACRARWAASPGRIYLSQNHRSNRAIVEWCNNYISSFPRMDAPNVRIPNKPDLRSARGEAAHPGVGLIRTSQVSAYPFELASLARDLLARGIISDYSQCVLLLRSVKGTPRYAGPFEEALGRQEIPVYNPRSRGYLDQPEVAQCLGALIRIVDPQLSHVDALLSGPIRDMVRGWLEEFDSIIDSNCELSDYVSTSARTIAASKADEIVTPNTPTIIYRILSREPFSTYQKDQARDMRLGKLTRLFEAFCAQYGRELRTDSTLEGELPGWWYGNFYYGLCGYLSRQGLDDDEEEDVICPPGHFPIMTIHQAKGLEFDFVFVGNLGFSVTAGSAHYLERDLRQFRINPPAVFHQIEESMWHDEIRQQFVAYSRAKHSLILLASDGQLRKDGATTAAFGGLGGGWVRQNVIRL